MLRMLKWLLPLLILLLLVLCTSACSPLPSAPANAQAVTPPLPAPARQPAPPPWCLPTCSAGLTRERENWLPTLTLPESPASPASAPTSR